MGLLRKHRFRNEVEGGSFGIGGFAAYTDKRVTFSETNGGIQAVAFDPNMNGPITVVDGLNGDTLDGVFHDPAALTVKEARLLDVNGAVTSSLATARWFDLIAHDGQASRFEVIVTGDNSQVNGGTTSGLLAQWALDEASGTTVADRTGAANHAGTFSIGTPPGFVTGKSGQAGDYAVSFDGTSQSINLGNPADLNFQGQITMSAWIKPSAASGWRSILGHGYTNPPAAQTSMEIYNNTLYVGAWPGNRPAAVALPADASTRFVHVVATYDGTNWNLYVDGVKKSTIADATGARTVNANWKIGSTAVPGDPRFFAGAIDDVRIYSRGLTDAEVAGLTAGTEPDATGLKARWDLNEGSGTVTADTTGNTAHAGILQPTQPVRVAGRTGQSGDGAIRFDGSNWVNLGNPSDLNVTGKITMTAWMKPEATDAVRTVVAHGHAAASPNNFTGMLFGNGNIYGGSWNGAWNWAGAVPAANIVSGGQWTHVAAEYDGNNWRMYLNGVFAGITNSGTGALSVNGDWRIGSGPYGADPRNFIGSIDDVRVYNRALSDTEIYALGGAQKSYGGRLVSLKNIKGYGLNVAYKYNPAANAQDAAAVQADPTLQWQMNTSADAYGNTVTYTYGAQQIAGQWVVSKADFSNGQSTTYEYADGLHLTKATHASGATSTFAYGVDSASQKTTVAINDGTADAGHEKKTAYLTNQITVLGGSADSAQVWNQSALMARQIRNGAGEVAYLNFTDATTYGGNSNNTTIYEGGNRVKVMNAEVSERFYGKGAQLVASSSSQPTIQGTQETSFASLPHWTSSARNTGAFADAYQPDGTYNTFSYDASAYPTQKNFTDGTNEVTQYDANHNVTYFKDRAGRIETKTYNAQNNLLTHTVGTGADAATTTYTYYSAGDVNQFLLKSETDPNGNTTDYAYDANHHLVSKTLPADVAGGARAVYAYEYDAAGRLSKSTDPVGRYVQYTYDSQDHVIRKDYCGVSHEDAVYGTGDNANRVIAQSDRDGNWTAYRYDAAGRVVKTIGGIAAQADAVNPNFVPDTTSHIVTENAYLPGCDLVASAVRNGERTEYDYDGRNRLVTTTVYSGADVNGVPQGQRTTMTYVDNKVFKTTDAFGRNTYYSYRTSDYQRVRVVKEATPGAVQVGGAAPTTYAQIAGLTRVNTPNAPYIIEDYVLDAGGLQTQITDGRGLVSQVTYDTRGRATIQKVAVGTSVQAQSQTIYDANSNVIELRSPRFFDAADAGGYNKATTTTAYTGRNLMASKTEAPGTAEAGTTTFTYYLDGTQATTTLPAGNVAGATQAQKDAQTTIQMNRPLCGWSLGGIDQAGHGTLTNTTIGGDAIHSIQVKDLKSLTTTDAHGLVIPNFLNEVSMDVPNANTISESTTKYDSRHRPIASTVWSSPLAAVWRDDVPVWFGNQVQGGAHATSSVPSGVTGQTTLYYYSEDLTSPTLTHAFGPAINIQPVLDKLTAASTDSPLLANGSNASARATMAPNGEVTVQIMDGLGRTVISGKLDTTAP